MTDKTRENTERFCVYILSCADGSFYTGMTNDLDRRLAEHRAGRGAQWTARRRPGEPVFSLEGLGYCSACEVERHTKSLSRARKQGLVERDQRMLALVRKKF